MADSKISALAAATSLAGTDEFVIATGGASKKVTMATLRAALDPELAYAEITSDASITATTEATANVVVTSGAVVLNGSTIVDVQFYAARMDNPGAGLGTFILLFDAIDGGAAAIVGYVAVAVAADAGLQIPVRTSYRYTPISGSHVYSIRGIVSSGTGSVQAGAGGSDWLPASLRVVRVMT